MKLVWIGGPLDGCTDEIERPRNLWISPDASDPDNKVVVYGLYTRAKWIVDAKLVDHEYRFSQDLTDKANAFLSGHDPISYDEGMN